MIVLFNEQDLVSFGNFMLSEERVKPYLQSEVIKDRVEEILKQVNAFDLEHWMKINQEAAKNAQLASQENSPIEEPSEDIINTLFEEPVTEPVV